MTEQQQPESADDRPTAGEDVVVVVGPDGQPIGTIPASALPEMTQDSGRRRATASATSPSWSSSPRR